MDDNGDADSNSGANTCRALPVRLALCRPVPSGSTPARTAVTAWGAFLLQSRHSSFQCPSHNWASQMLRVYKLKARPFTIKKDYNSLYRDTCLTALAWSRTHRSPAASPRYAGPDWWAPLSGFLVRKVWVRQITCVSGNILGEAGLRLGGTLPQPRRCMT